MKQSSRFLITTLILSICFLFVPDAWAQTTPVASGPATSSLADMMFNFLGAFLNMLYMISLPVLIIAGKAIDNSMVYGEFMNLDKPLYTLWNLCRTLANFAIGGVLLWQIFSNIFSGWKDEAPALIKKLLIKSVLIILGINLSRFGIGALLDLSTIATYSLGALPLGALKEVNKGSDMPLLAIASYFDFQSDTEASVAGMSEILDPYVYYKRGQINISPCDNLYNGFIVGPKYYPNLQGKPEVSFSGRNVGEESIQYCALTPQSLGDITSLEQWKDTNFVAPFFTGGRENNSERNKIMVNVLEKLSSGEGCTGDLEVYGSSGMSGLIAQSSIAQLGPILQFGSSDKLSYEFCKESTPIIVSTSAPSQTGWTSVFSSLGTAPYSQQESKTLNKLINQSEGMVGPFVTLYLSILNYSNLSHLDTNNLSLQSSIGGFTEFLLKAVISIAIFIPLVALAGVLIIRVILLRGLIAFIPLGIVLIGFKDQLGGLGSGGIKMPSRLAGKDGVSLEGNNAASSLIGLIFAPILPVFVIGISIIILQTFQGELSKSLHSDNQTWQFLGVQSISTPDNPNLSCLDFWGMQELCYQTDPSTNSGSGFANLIPRLFVNIFAIALMWMLFKVSLSSSKLTAGVGEGIMNLGAKALSTMPIGISVGGAPLRAGTLTKFPGMLSDVADETIRRQNTEAYEALSNKLGSNTEKQASTTSGSSSSAPSNFVIKNPEKAKTEFVKTAATNQAATQALEQRFQHFEQALTTDVDAKKAFHAMNPEDKSLTLLNFIDQLDAENQKKIDTDQLKKQILNTRLANITNTTDQQQKQELEKDLRNFITTQSTLGGFQELATLYQDNPDYQKIITALSSGEYRNPDGTAKEKSDTDQK